MSESGRQSLSAKQAELAGRVAATLASSTYPAGHRITEELLTAQFHVSRSPVRAVMQFLADKGFLVRGARGFYVPDAFPDLGSDHSLIPQSADQQLYDLIAQDRARDLVPEQFSESEFMRRYEVPRSQLIRVLNRLALDGVVEPAVGHGWRFFPTLNSEPAYRDSYRFRMMIEPQGLLEPDFRLDRDVLQKMRNDQIGLTEDFDPRRLFELNAAFHETLAAFSNNSFILEAVRRHGRLRRLNEQLAHDQERANARIQEHVAIIDALLNDQREWAASLLRHHLDVASRISQPFDTQAQQE